MKVQFGKLRRLAYGVLALATVGAVSLPALSGTASAATVSNRYVKMDRANSGATGITYEIGFTLNQAHSGLQGIVIEFCNESPIINNTTCTKPGTGSTAFSVGTPSATVSGSFTTAGTWTFGSLNSGRTFYANNTTANSVSASTAGTVTITTMTNPDTSNTPFYARIYTYTTTGHAAGYTLANPAAGGAVRDSGGVAMSTSSSVNISATVQEQLTFCVSKAAPTSGCGGVTTPNIVLGTGTPVILTTGTAQTDTAYHQITTNASGNVVVRLKNISSTACAGLSKDSGATCDIAGKGAFGTIGSSAGLFGLNVANGSGGTGTVNADTDYGTTGGSYGMATATYGAYGDIISQTVGAVTDVNSLLTYAANAAPTTPAGVYTATHSLVATGTY